ncbi:MAG: hypothetical protein VYB08_01160, partial [Candidatus Latescibacterota bacterium]|nr:hypothetical protein [Candidatus Latescibacterota bacterium]
MDAVPSASVVATSVPAEPDDDDDSMCNVVNDVLPVDELVSPVVQRMQREDSPATPRSATGLPLFERCSNVDC